MSQAAVLRVTLDDEEHNLSDMWEFDGPDVRLIENLVGLGLRPGDIMPSEAEVAAAMHAGRPQVREALRVLEGYGAIRSRQGARRVWLGFQPEVFGRHLAAVVCSSDQALQDLFEIRHAFETSHIGQVTARMTAAQQDGLRATVAAMTAAAKRGEPVQHQDEAFHRQLFSEVDNRVFEGVSSAFWHLHDSLRSGDDQVEDLLSIAAMHARILEAVLARDVRLAVHELDAHFWGVRRRIYDDRGVPAPS